MKPSLVLLISMLAPGCAAFAANGVLAVSNSDYGWKIGAGGTRVMHSDDGGKTWRDVSPPTLIAVSKNVRVNATPAHALVADSKNGNPAFPKGPFEMAKIFVAMSARDATISIIVKAPANGKPEIALYEHTTDGGKTWWKELPEDDVSKDDKPKPLMFGVSDGWLQKSTGKKSSILQTRDGGRHWLDVSPPALPVAVKKLIAEEMDFQVAENAALCPLDARRAWASIVRVDLRAVLLEYTGDAGRHWKEISAPIATDVANISFVDEQHGFLLATGQPAAGHMDKKVYATDDGAKRWYVLSPPPAGGCYPTGISFRSPLDGWIAATYHGGDDAPLYCTHNGGKTWKLQKLPIPADYSGGYVDTLPPVFIGKDKMHGYLPVHLVRHDPSPDHHADVNFETDDGGQTWHLPVSGVHSVGEVKDE